MGRKEGEALWEERVSIEDLKETRLILGVKNFAALYQQEPIDDEEAHFSINNIQYFNGDEDEVINNEKVSDSIKFITIDPASSESKSADYTVIAVCAKNKNEDLFVYHILRKHIPIGSHHIEISNIADRFGVVDIYLESNNFQGLIKKDLDSRKYNIREIIAKNNKDNRSLQLKYLINKQKLFLKSNSNWIDDLILELEEFPNSRHDDQVDALSYAAKIEIKLINGKVFGTNYPKKKQNSIINRYNF